MVQNGNNHVKGKKKKREKEGETKFGQRGTGDSPARRTWKRMKKGGAQDMESSSSNAGRKEVDIAKPHTQMGGKKKRKQSVLN